MSQATKDYHADLEQMDDPRDDDSSIDYAVSAKLLTESKEEEATWLAESITERDNEVLMGYMRSFLDKRDSVNAIHLADALAEQLGEYMRGTICDDYEALEPDNAEPESNFDHYEENKLRLAA